MSKAQERERIGGAHVRIVEPGDTVYGIAFANGIEAHRLAAWNQLNDTSKLRVGQRIRLTKPLGFVAKSRSKTTAGGKSKPVTNKNAKNQKPVKPVAAVKKSTTSRNAVSRPKNQLWQWPTQGKVVQRFDKSVGEQGIDIAGGLGQPISASRAGEVVYVGNGLKGYGNLVILKHDEEFLSAYAHNQETFVEEGQKLAVGSRIATMGRNRQQVVLHFQIRQHGDPVDPLRFLTPR